MVFNIKNPLNRGNQSTLAQAAVATAVNGQQEPAVVPQIKVTPETEAENADNRFKGVQVVDNTLPVQRRSIQKLASA